MTYHIHYILQYSTCVIAHLMLLLSFNDQSSAGLLDCAMKVLESKANRFVFLNSLFITLLLRELSSQSIII